MRRGNALISGAMRILVTRGGELAVPVGPFCDNDNCDCATLAALDSGHPIDVATVAERPDVTTSELQAAAAHFLQITGWAAVDSELDAELDAELAAGMAADVAEIAASWPPATQLLARFDRPSEAWVFRQISA
jgi:hypothetical protein